MLPAQRPDKALFLTAGSGITPVMGMLRNHPELTDVVLVHSAPTADDVVFGAELRALAADGRIRLVEQHTDTAGMLDAASDRRPRARPARARHLGLRAGGDARGARGSTGRRPASPTGCTPNASARRSW